MQASFRRNLSSLARRGGLHAPLRAVYNFLFLSRSTRGLTIGPLRAEFKTPTHTIAEHVESWGGERVLLGGLLEELRGDDVFWDIGASFGLYTVFAAKKLASPGSVVAFEPEPDMRELLEKNLVLNGIRSVNVRATALGDRDGVTGLFRAANPNSGTSSLAQRRDYRLKKKEIAVELSRETPSRSGKASSPRRASRSTSRVPREESSPGWRACSGTAGSDRCSAKCIPIFSPRSGTGRILSNGR